MRVFAAFAGALLLCSSANAGDLQPMAAHSIHLGEVNGTTYYTVEADGFRVVTTVAAGDGTPVRVVTTLLPGQSTTISVPRSVGESELFVQLSRVNDQVIIARPKTTASAD